MRPITIAAKAYPRPAAGESPAAGRDLGVGFVRDHAAWAGSPHLARARRLPSPRQLRRLYPRTPQAHRTVACARRRIRDLLHGRDDRRLLAVVGPCSLHDPLAALEYAGRLARLADALRDQLVVVMRAYVEKPRTATGWKGLVNDPHLDGSCDVAAGLRMARRLLLQINERGLPCATEFLDPGVAPYLADLVSWGCIGARTAESQVHRQLASGLPLPVGFKNATDGRVEVAHHAILAARQPHSYVGVG